MGALPHLLLFGLLRVDDMSGPAARNLRRKPWHPLLARVVKSLNGVTSFIPPPPSPVQEKSERVLVVKVHPYGREPSFTLALGQAVCDSLEASGGGWWGRAWLT